MNYLDMLCEEIDRARERFLRMLEGVSLEEANSFPVADITPQVKSLTWLTWHTARELDLQIAHLAKTETIWVEQLFEDKFSFEVGQDEDGWNHTLEQAKKIVVDDFTDLKTYLNASCDFAITYLKSLEEASFDAVVDDSWTPPVTRGVRLVSIIDDAAMHSGQAIYARRLLGLKD